MGKETEEGGGEDAPGQGRESVLADEGDEDHDEVGHQQRTAAPPDATQRPDESGDDERGTNESEGGQRCEVLVVGIAGMIGQGGMTPAQLRQAAVADVASATPE